MSLVRSLSVWMLRGLLAWGAFEGAASLYDQVNEKSADLMAVGSHTDATERLRARATAAEASANALEERLGNQLHISWSGPTTDTQAAANSLRQTLIDLGAQAPVVDATLSPASDGIVRVAFIARWREPQETSPAILYALAARFPDVSLAHLSVTRADGLVATEAQMTALAAANPGRPGR